MTGPSTSLKAGDGDRAVGDLETSVEIFDAALGATSGSSKRVREMIEEAARASAPGHGAGSETEQADR